MDINEENIPCPYNPNHKIHPLRMPYHLMKCRKNHPDVRLAVCPYSASHEVPPIELQHHMANCPDKRLVEGLDTPNALLFALTGREASTTKGCTDIPPPVYVEFENDGENWDQDLTGGRREQSSHLLPTRLQRSHGRHTDDTSSIHSFRNPSSRSANLNVRRPVSQSVAERLKKTRDSEISDDQSQAGHLSCDSMSDDGRDNFITSNISDLQISSNIILPHNAEHNSVDISQRLSGRPASLEGDEFEKNTKISSFTSAPLMRGRGRAIILDHLSEKLERKPGIKTSQSVPFAGRGRFLSKVPVKD